MAIVRVLILTQVVALFAALLPGMSTVVLGQASAVEKAAAEALFDTGLSLMRSGDYEQACVKLEESQEIEPGIGTQLYLAECYEHLGRTASAWALFREAASAASARGQKSRADVGARRAEELEPKLSKVVVVMADGARETPGLTLQAGALTVPKQLWGVPVPVDPGELSIRAEAPGFLPWTGTFLVPSQPVTVTIEIPSLQLAPAPVAVSSGPSASEAGRPGEPSMSHPGTDSAHVGDTQRLAGVVAGGVGVVALGVGAVFGLRAIQKNSDAEDAGCSESSCPTKPGITASEDAQSAATLSTVFVAGGFAALAAGGLLYLLAPDGTEMAIQVGPALSMDGRGAGLWARGSF